MPAKIDFPSSIRKSGLTIYDEIKVGDPALWIPSPELEQVLKRELVGVSLAGLPLRTRSKVLKTHVCEALGYPVPKTFTKTQPRFPGQNFDTYVQKSNNLQVWNEELSSGRRYVLVRVGARDLITNVRVVTGKVLAELDTTGTLTQKYQAQLVRGEARAELISAQDTRLIRPLISPAKLSLRAFSPTDNPSSGLLLPIDQVFAELKGLVGASFPDAGVDQERNRGAALHRIVCERLGFKNYADDGQFPDIKHQIIEVKLQTSPTIDLGLVTPDSKEPLDVPMIAGNQVRHCDVRYALFYGEIVGGNVVVRNLYLTTGEDFFSRFPRFGGKVLNKKLQIPLPRDFL